jgi:hypothetical protein
MERDKTKYNDWTLIDWDGNTTLGYKCWRKSFGRGHVSVGVGNFDLIVYSHGANSDESLSSTRWRKNGNISENDAMKIVDANGGYHNHKKNEINLIESK